jgi:hypothetical protein
MSRRPAPNLDGQGKPTSPKYESQWDRRPPCAHADCARTSLVRVKTATGLANLCLDHHNAYWHGPGFADKLKAAERRNHNPVVDEIRAAYLKSQARKAAPPPLPERVPGEDDEKKEPAPF